MFVVNDDLSIYATRGDIVCLNVSATDDKSGGVYEFQPGDIVRMKIFAKKDAESVYMQKDIPVVAKTDTVGILLTEQDTKIGDVISKPTDFWYEIELNPYTNPQTIVGYDEDGAKIFKLFPEGKDITTDEPTEPEDIPVVDVDLDLISSRPVENRAIARAITLLKNDLQAVDERLTGKIRENKNTGKDLEEQLVMQQARFDNLIAHENATLSENLQYIEAIGEETKSKIDGKIESDGVFANITINLREANLIYGGTEIDMFIIPDKCNPWETGLIHTEDGLEYRIKYDGKRYYMAIKAQDSVTVAPSEAGTVTMSYALYDYEVKDIRVGFDGNTYDSAGAAVRRQVDNLNTNIKGMFESGEMQMFPLWERGGIDGENGRETVAEGRFRTSDYIAFDVDELAVKVASGYMVYYFGYTFDGENYTIAMNSSCDENETIVLDPNMVYRLVVRSLGEDDYMEVSELENVQFVYKPDVVYAKNDSLELTNRTVRDIAEHGYVKLESPWVVGGINGGNGTFTSGTDRIRTAEYYRPVSNFIHYVVAEGYRVLAYEYTKDSETGEYTFVKTHGYYTEEGVFEASVDSLYLFMLRAIEAKEFDGSEYSNVLLYSPISLSASKSDENGIPVYWEDTIEQKEREIKNIVIEATKKDNDIAMFFTTADSHYPENTYVSTALWKRLADRCGINLMVNLGDIITDSTVSHEDGLQRIQDAMAHLAKGTDRMILTQGNHDNNAGIKDGNGQILAERIVYDNEWIHHTSAKLLSLNKLVFDDKRKAFYYDDDLQKIRFISIDSFEDKTYTINDGVVESYNLGRPSERQIAWIKDVALATVPDGYAVVSFSHMALFAPYVYNGTEYVSLGTGKFGNSEVLIEAFANFKNSGGTYIGHFAGHLHHDFVSTVDGITCVQSLNDGMHWRQASYFAGFEFVGDAPVKTEGTTTECAFDAVIINKTTRHVDLIRVGAGENRSFDY